MAENEVPETEAEAIDAEEQYILSVDEMLAADDVEYKTIATWKVKGRNGQMVQGYTRIRSLTAEQVQKWRDAADGPAKKNAGIRLFVDSLVDKEGRPIGNAGHYEAFRKKSNAIQDKVLDQILEMNNLKPKQQTAVKND